MPGKILVGFSLNELRHDSSRLQEVDTQLGSLISEWRRELRKAFLCRSFRTDISEIEESLARTSAIVKEATEQFASLYLECIGRFQATVGSRWYSSTRTLAGIARLFKCQTFREPIWAPHTIAASYGRFIEEHAKVAATGESVKSSEATKQYGVISSKPVMAELSKAICIIQLTPPGVRNPFFRVFGDALAGQGYDYRYSINFKEIERVIRTRPPGTTILHLHQLDALYRNRRIFSRDAEASATQLFERMSYFRALGAHVVWTFHDLTPQSGVEIDLDKDCTRIMLSFADRVIVLGECPKQYVSKLIGSSRVSVVPHPALDQLYQKFSFDGASIRKKLGITPDTLVFGSLGRMMPYKRLESLIDGFDRYSKIGGSPKSKLVLFGGSGDLDYLAKLRRMADGRPHITISDSLVPDHEVPATLAALDWSVFAMRDIWMPSSVSLSLSLGIPVIGPTVGCIPEIVKASGAGILYDPFDADGLVQAMMRAGDSSLRERFARQTERYRQRYQIAACVEILKSVYADTLSEAGRG